MMFKNSITALFIVGFILTACNTDLTVAEPTAESAVAVVEGGTTAVQVVVAANDFEVGTPRIPIIFFDGPQMSADILEAEMTVFDLSQEPAAIGWSGMAINYTDYEIPYWVFHPEIPSSGIWGIVASVTLPDGNKEDIQFTIQIEAENSAPLIGDKGIPSENRTLETEPDINKLTSGQEPLPALYQMTVAEAMTSGRPTVIAFNTPAFCQTAICSPVLQSVEKAYEQYSDQANFIHLEIFKEFNPLVQADEVTEWDLPSEPWTFVLDKDGVVQARLAGPVSPSEIASALEPLLDS